MPVVLTRILLIEPDEQVQKRLADFFGEEGYLLYAAAEGKRALAMIYNDPPDLIVMDVNEKRKDPLRDLCREIKGDNIYGHLPIIALIQRRSLEVEFLDGWMLDDFVCKPLNLYELSVRIRLILSRGEKNLDANALTRLPGNNTIIQQIQRRIEAKISFALAYLDIDHFKAFNDRYGFSRGDEALRMTARLVGNVVNEMKDPHAFVGHIGGDDFVFLASPGVAVPACEEIIRNFDQIVPIFYDERDRVQGYIASVDRQGKPTRYPIMTLSIGVALSPNLSGLAHFGQITSVATEMKKFAKMHPGSCYKVDRRKS